jgi:hypothetical protein
MRRTKLMPSISGSILFVMTQKWTWQKESAQSKPPIPTPKIPMQHWERKVAQKGLGAKREDIERRTKREACQDILKSF